MDQSKPGRSLHAFLNLIARYRDEDAMGYDVLAAGYDAFAAPWNDQLAKPALDHLYALVAEQLPPGGRILDAGCGTGDGVRRLLEMTDASEIVALDCSPKMLDMARRKIADRRVRFVEGDVRRLPFADNTFDAVISTWVLECFSHPHRIAEEYIRVINENGLVAYSFITIPRRSARKMADEFTRQMSEASAEARHFLQSSRMPFHQCSRSSLSQFRGGLLSVATLSKFCRPEPARLPRHESGSAAASPSGQAHQPE